VNGAWRFTPPARAVRRGVTAQGASGWRPTAATTGGGGATGGNGAGDDDDDDMPTSAAASRSHSGVGGSCRSGVGGCATGTEAAARKSAICPMSPPMAVCMPAYGQSRKAEGRTRGAGGQGGEATRRR
jgi:hypothetical protein